MENKTLLTILAVALLGLLGVTVTETVSVPLPLQQAAEAKLGTGQCASFFKNASSQICHNFF